MNKLSKRTKLVKNRTEAELKVLCPGGIPARLGNRVSLGGQTRIMSPDVFLGDYARLRDHAYIEGTAVVDGRAEVSGDARVSGEAMVGDAARVTDQSTVTGRAMVSGSAEIKERARIFGTARISGTAIIKGDARISAGHITGGVWKQQPLVVYGTRDLISNSKPGYIKIGCIERTFAQWLKHYRSLGREHNYTAEQIKEYGRHIRYVIKHGRH